MTYEEVKRLTYQDISEVMGDIYNELKYLSEKQKRRNAYSIFPWEKPNSVALDSTNLYELLADWHAGNLATEDPVVIISSSQLPVQSVVISFLSLMAGVSLSTLRSGNLIAEGWQLPQPTFKSPYQFP